MFVQFCRANGIANQTWSLGWADQSGQNKNYLNLSLTLDLNQLLLMCFCFSFRVTLINFLPTPYVIPINV